MKKSAAVLALMVLALAGCASAPDKDVEYESLNDFATAYEEALDGKVECRRTERDIQKYGWDHTQCGQRTVLMMFTSDAKREEILEKNPLEEGKVWVQGPNWIVDALQYEAEDAQAALGGTLRD